MNRNGTHLTKVSDLFVFDISQMPDDPSMYTIYNEATKTYLCKTNGLSATSTYSPDTCRWNAYVYTYNQVVFYYTNPMRYLNWYMGKWCASNADAYDTYLWKVTGEIFYTTIID